MATDLTRIGERARKDGKCRFTSLFHHVTDMDNLRACYEAMGKGKAPGVDGVITDNGPGCEVFRTQMMWILYRGLNRRSQRRSYTWKQFYDLLRWVEWPTVRIRHNLCPFRVVS